MKRILPLLLVPLFLTGFSQINRQNQPLSQENEGYLELEIIDASNPNVYKVIGLNDTTLKEYRIYHEYDDGVIIDEISDNAFNHVNNTFTVLISNLVSSFTSDLFTNPYLTAINFTGSQTEWANKNIATAKTVNYYQKDEGFVNYWNTYVRPDSESDICSIQIDGYRTLKNMYNALGARDLIKVNAYVDASGSTIEDAVLYLKSYFQDDSESHQSPSNQMSQDTTIGLIVGIAFFGMTTISIFYLLKRKGIIG